MINFRFHLVSLTAVFLALAAGIAIGAGVVDRQTVGFLEDRLQTVEDNREETNAENDALRADLALWSRFSEEAGDRIVSGRLQDVPVVVVGVAGTDRGMVDGMRASMQGAGAAVQGSLWFTGKWALTEDDDVRELAQLVNAPLGAPPEDVRTAAVGRVNASWVAGSPDEVMVALRDAGFLEFDPPAGQGLDLRAVALAQSSVVIVSGSEAEITGTDLALPLVRGLRNAGLHVLAAEPTPPPAEDDEGPTGAGIASLVRGDDDVASQVSTVDNVNDYRGRIAAVLAIAELRRGRSGHYGTANGAQRLLPEFGG